jgi:hypothetical protein
MRFYWGHQGWTWGTRRIPSSENGRERLRPSALWKVGMSETATSFVSCDGCETVKVIPKTRIDMLHSRSMRCCYMLLCRLYNYKTAIEAGVYLFVL